MLEGQLGILSGMIGAYLADGIVPGPLGTAYGALLPYQTFRTKTRDIAIGIGSDKLWRTFCPLLGLAAADRRSALCDQRGAQREPAVARRGAAGRVSDEDLRGMGSRSCCRRAFRWARSTRSTRSSSTRRSPRAARSSSATHPVAGAIRMTAPPVRMSETPGAVRTPAPLLGEHTDEVLRERLGLGDEEIARLRRAAGDRELRIRNSQSS